MSKFSDCRIYVGDQLIGEFAIVKDWSICYEPMNSDDVYEIGLVNDVYIPDDIMLEFTGVIVNE